MNEKLKFSIANNTVTHLGRNLYSTTPPALAELIANSFDAYATEVNVSLEKDNIYVIDNGKGLNFTEFKDKYAVIGSAKQNENPLPNMKERKPMGKKGIGKLAAFSLGNKYTVYSKTKDSDNWISFSLNYDDMIEEDNYVVEVKEVCLPKKFKKYNSYKSGFIVDIDGIRRNITAQTKKNILTQLARRFYINKEKHTFVLKINDQEISLDSNLYYNKIQYLVYFGENSKDKNFKAKFPNSKHFEKYSKKEEISKYFKEKNIYGWIGTTSKPKDLKNEDGASFSNIILLANGKIADEDILKSKSNARIANSYIVGEIFADEFISNLNDPITSSRQGLDDSITEVEELINNIDKIRAHVIDRWDNIRLEDAVENLPNRIKDNHSYKKWLDTLSEEQKNINNKLLNLLSSRLDDDTSVDEQAVESMITSIAGVINNIETDQLISSFDEEIDDNKKINLLLKLMANVAKTEDLNHSNLIKKRIEAINKLENLMSNSKAKEKLFEEHLADNPWLINPYWNIDRNNNTEFDSIKTQKYYKSVKIDNEFKRNFIDIIIRVAEEQYPIIVELKKNHVDSYSNVTYTKIYDQISAYRNAIKQNMQELKNVEDSQIPAIFILSEDTGVNSGNKINLSEKELELLEKSNIKILKYNQILHNARKMYKQHLEFQKQQNIYPNLKDI